MNHLKKYRTLFVVTIGFMLSVGLCLSVLYVYHTDATTGVIYEVEPNNSSEEATTNMVYEGFNQYGTFYGDDMVDYWKLNIERATKINIFLDQIPKESNYNLYLYPEHSDTFIWKSEEEENAYELGTGIDVQAGVYDIVVVFEEGESVKQNYLLRYRDVEKVVWPVPDSTVISDYFLSRGGAHQGVDISWAGTFPLVQADLSGCMNAPCRSGNDIVSAFSGTVSNMYQNDTSGSVVEIESSIQGDTLLASYHHVFRSHVAIGDVVHAGDRIAVMGNTGHTIGMTGVHLHMELRKNGVLIDPLTYISPPTDD
ncbi:M23 family metallopeptidase [Longirhabdus pacifica]|uniref:M23 family metallopeptidase n=1 Tax=Longirhabdus pacifica TaxID=2305227 RepID=UPI0010086E97|nr:M23 family metallopeptidase [Longirhabdus pacifica]